MMMPVRVTDVCDEVIPEQGYRTPAWHEARRGCVSASEIAAVLGLSRFQSAFDLWWSKRNNDRTDDNAAMSRGRRCEPLVLEDFCEEHPAISLRHVGLVRNKERPWQVATPDAIAYEHHGRDWPEAEPLGVVEAKTDGGSDHWGDKGTDQIPVDYKAQVIWQMDTVGVTTAWLPVWLGFTYRCYLVQYDPADAEFMRTAARDFLDSLDRDEPPAVDGHRATTERLKRLHVEVVDRDVEVPEHLVQQYLAAHQLRDRAAARMALAENRLRAIVGDAKRGVLPDGRRALTRSVYDVEDRVQVVKAHTVSRINVKPLVKETRTSGRLLDPRPVRCSGRTKDGEPCKRVRVTSARTWTCHTHGGDA